jgi:hypothetical protein
MSPTRKCEKGTNFSTHKPARKTIPVANQNTKRKKLKTSGKKRIKKSKE